MARVVVVGGGVVGLSCAYYLLRDGHQVTVIDRDGATKGASWGNAGMIVPSHFEPMANPAMMALGLKMAREKDGPLGFAKTPALARWSMAFAASATEKHVRRTQMTLLRLNRHSRACYFEIFPHGLNMAGLLMVCQTESAFNAEQHLSIAAMKVGLSCEIVGAVDLRSMSFRGAGGIWFKEDAYLTPYDFMPWITHEVLAKGGKILQATADSIVKEKGRVKAIRTDQGAIDGDEFVLAAGAWSGRLSSKLLITAGRGYGFTVNNPPLKTSISAILVEARVATTPMSNGQRFTGVMELGAFGNEVSKARLDRIRRSIPDYLPAYAQHEFTEDVWVGHRPCSFDGVPYIGRYKRLENLIAATGHGMMGMSLGPGTGKLVSQIVAGAEPDIDLRWCSPDR